MTNSRSHSAHRPWRLPLGILMVAFCFILSPGYGQNTKGDKPIPNQKKIREVKFKAVKKKRQKGKTRDISGRRLRTKNKSSASRANASFPQPKPYTGKKLKGNDRPASPSGRIFNNSPRERNHKAWRGDISGHKIRVQSDRSRRARARANIYPQKGPYVNNPSRRPSRKHRTYTRTASGAIPIRIVPSERQRPWKGNIKGGRVGTPSRSGRVKNVYPQTGPFVNHSSRSPRENHRAYPNGASISRARKREHRGGPGRQYQVFPRSSSRSFIQRGRKNVYWGKFSKGEKPFTRDLTGRPLRTRNFHTQPSGLFSRDTLKFFGRRPHGDRAAVRKRGGYVSATMSGRAWKGDISGHKIRGRNYSSHRGERAGKFVFPRKLSISRSGKVGRPLPGGGFVSRSQPGERRTGKNPLPPRTPGIGASGLAKYLNRITGRRPVKGGGSVSGKRWNNKGQPLNVRTGGAGSERAARFQGNFKRGELTPGFNKQGIGYAGNIKTGKPAKGGGSISGKLWNNRQSPIPVRTPGGDAGRIAKYQGTFRRGTLNPGFTKQGADFRGNIKTHRPAKGGGSISGKLWNNQGNPISVRTPGGSADKIAKYQGTFRRGTLNPGFTKQGADFRGNIKAKRPAKGGGSISGKLWNNKETPINVKAPGKGAEKPGEFSGNIKATRPKKGGGSISGKLWNNNEQPINVRTPKGDAREADYAGRIKLPWLKRNYVQNPNADKLSIKKQRPGKSTYEVAGLQVRVKQGDYKTKPNAAKGSLPGVAPQKSTVKASEYARGVKVYWQYKHNPSSNDNALKSIKPGSKWNKATSFQGQMKLSGRYRHNPNSDDEAIKMLAPGKAYAKVGNYQGNIRMHKYSDRRLHPDARFAHGFRDNVKEERTIFMNVKLFWAKLFKRSSTQPSHLKEKIRKPRYDKGEQGMWYD